MSKEIKEGAVVRHAHVEGALVLARLRGVEAFRERGEVKALLGLTLNATVCCLSARRKISEPIRKMREHAATVVDGADMNWRLSGVLSDVVDLVADIHANTLTLEEKTARCARLDSCLEAISHEATSTWSYESVIVPAEHRAGSLPSDSPSLYNIYPSRAVMHTWNVLRLLRILLREELISHFPTSTHSTLLLQPPPSITPTIRQICASVPQMIACSSAASHKLPPGSPCQHPHSPSSGLLHTIPHLLDAYILIFPLYVAGWSRYCSPPTRVWILDQLEYIGTHFGLMAANVVREVLLRDTGSGGVESWVARRKQFDFVLSRHIADFYGLGL
ncbi:hypothetical protein C7974DRAFT_437879 [Boeremia exigua]|uniref:uncharacterized protein n=1 Tax=Boeremia exigua TaxID=749465 RepID=UPI001E8D3E2C|nr:uncharacterized protein C7974DRAFT_437879 [Boeremia exigua]KAH6612591.1 hypothetical protein C7974DRAFT_437879 [Boeremia exigua]